MDLQISPEIEKVKKIFLQKYKKELSDIEASQILESLHLFAKANLEYLSKKTS